MARNGFGPPLVSLGPVLESKEYTTRLLKVQELDGLLRNATYAVEASVHPIVPAVVMTRLHGGGNMMVKGNVTCLNTDPKWQQTLPNLPKETYMVVVKQRGKRSDLRSFQFRKADIEHILKLIKELQPSNFCDIVVDPNRLHE